MSELRCIIFLVICYTLSISASNDPEMPASCSPVPKNNLEKVVWLTSDFKNRFCIVSQCTLDLFDKGLLIRFDGEVHTLENIKDAKPDPNDEFDMANQALKLDSCKKQILGNNKMDCKNDEIGFMKITMCSLGMDHTKEENMEKIEDFFKSTLKLT